jgi:hypothetical protein
MDNPQHNVTVSYIIAILMFVAPAYFLNFGWHPIDPSNAWVVVLLFVYWGYLEDKDAERRRQQIERMLRND